MKLKTLAGSSNLYLPVGFGIILLIAYMPLILFGGIIVDDWGAIQGALGCAKSTFWSCLQTHYPLWANRPIAPIPITFFTFIFGTFYSGYLITNSIIYLGAVLITASVLKKITGFIPALFFACVASFPAISMPIIVSPVVQMTATIAYLYWAISLYCICRSVQTSSKVSYFIGYLFLLFSFLTYEVILPLLVLTTLLPYFYIAKEKQKPFSKYVIDYLLPVILILGITVQWQKVIAPAIFSVVYSRLSLDLSHISREFNSWASVFIAQIPTLVQKIPRFLNVYNVSSTVLVLISLGYAIKQSTKISLNKRQFYYLVTASLCFLSSSLIFILSGQSADIGGYQSRGLSSTWFTFCILISAIIWVALSLPIIFRILLAGLVILVCGTNFLTYLIQSNNYIESWRMQKAIIADATELIEKKSIKNALILGNVPTYVKKNFNNEIVFGAPWDFGAALGISMPNNGIGGAVIDTRNGQFHQLEVHQDHFLLDAWWRGEYKNLWLYDFDPESKKGSITKINGPVELSNQLTKDGKLWIGSLGSYLNLLPGEKLVFSKDWHNKKSIMEHGWSGTEDWGMWSIGDTSIIYLPLPRTHYPKLIINARAFVTSKFPTLNVDILLNDASVKSFVLSNFKSNRIELPVPAEIYKNSFVKITFKIQNPTSPKENGLNDADDRKLGIGLIDLEFQ
jgi:hypothetical protein